MATLQERLSGAVAPRYLVDRELAVGGMGVVFLGRDPVLGREVAIKVLPPEMATAVATERFLREAKVLAKLTHPHVVPILEAHRGSGLLWFVMPRITGDALSHRLATEGPLVGQEFRRLGLELLDALDHAHRHGVIHRDIKPSNIFLQDAHALLADFGIALLAPESSDGDSDSLTEPDQVVGTRRYMAPEQYSIGSVSTASDIYSMAATLHEAATGSTWDPAASQDGRWNRLPARVAAVLRRATSAAPSARWADAREFRDAFEAATRPRRSRLAIGAAAGTLVLGSVLISRLLSSSSLPPAPAAEVAIRPFSGNVPAARVSERMVQILRGFPLLTVALSSSSPGDPHPDAAVEVGGELSVDGSGAGTLALDVNRAGGTDLVRVGGSAGAIDDWAQAAADSLVARLHPEWVLEFREFSAEGRPLAARQAYLEGKSLFEGRRWDESEVEFRKAVSLDPGFALARWMTLIAMKWRRVGFADDSLRAFLPEAAALADPWRGLAVAVVDDDLARRLSRLEALARRYPRHDLSRLLYANELFSRGPLVGFPLDRGVAEFSRAAEDLPDLAQADTYLHLTWGALRLGDRPLARRALGWFDAARAPEDEFAALLHQAYRGRFQPPLAGVFRTALRLTAGASDAASFAGMVRLGLAFDDPDDQLAIADVVIARAPESGMVADGWRARATALLLQGRLGAAMAALDSAAAERAGADSLRLESAEWALLLPLIGVAVPDSVRAAAHRRIAGLPVTDPRWPRAAWVMVLDHTARGPSPVADSLVMELAARAPGLPLAAEVLPYAQAALLAASGRLDSALVVSERIHRDPGERLALGRGPMLRPMVYLSRSAWLERRNRSDDALRELAWHENNDLRGWPTGALQEGEMDAAMSAIGRLRRGTLLLAMGNDERHACAMLVRVGQLWASADASFADLRQAAASAHSRCRT